MWSLLLFKCGTFIGNGALNAGHAYKKFERTDFVEEVMHETIHGGSDNLIITTVYYTAYTGSSCMIFKQRYYYTYTYMFTNHND